MKAITTELKPTFFLDFELFYPKCRDVDGGDSPILKHLNNSSLTVKQRVAKIISQINPEARYSLIKFIQTKIDAQSKVCLIFPPFLGTLNEDENHAWFEKSFVDALFEGTANKDFLNNGLTSVRAKSCSNPPFSDLNYDVSKVIEHKNNGPVFFISNNDDNISSITDSNIRTIELENYSKAQTDINYKLENYSNLEDKSFPPNTFNEIISNSLDFTVDEEEWATAKHFLKDAKDGAKLTYSATRTAGGTLEERKNKGTLYQEIERYNKDNPTQPQLAQTTHSFILFDGKIYAVAQGKDQKALLGEGASGKVKIIKNLESDFIAIKIKKNATHDFKETNEEKIAQDLKISQGQKNIKSLSGTDDNSKENVKSVILMKYRGKTLYRVLREAEQNSIVLEDNVRLDLAIKVALAVYDLHTGKAAISGQIYSHGDIKPENITIDADGNVHLIDFGFTEKGIKHKLTNPKKEDFQSTGYSPQWLKNKPYTAEQKDIYMLKKTLQFTTENEWGLTTLKLFPCILTRRLCENLDLDSEDSISILTTASQDTCEDITLSAGFVTVKLIQAKLKNAGYELNIPFQANSSKQNEKLCTYIIELYKANSKLASDSEIFEIIKKAINWTPSKSVKDSLVNTVPNPQPKESPLNKDSSKKIINKARGVLMGMPIGDALGRPFEFYDFRYPVHSSTSIPLFLSMKPGWKKDREKKYNLQAGIWTDDASQAACLIDACMKMVQDQTESGEERVFPAGYFMEQVYNWYQYGLYSGLSTDKNKTCSIGLGSVVSQSIDNWTELKGIISFRFSTSTNLDDLSKQEKDYPVFIKENDKYFIYGRLEGKWQVKEVKDPDSITKIDEILKTYSSLDSKYKYIYPLQQQDLQFAKFIKQNHHDAFSTELNVVSPATNNYPDPAQTLVEYRTKNNIEALADGNGSTMRNGACAVFARDVEEAMRLADQQSRATTPGDEAAACAQLLAYLTFKGIHSTDYDSVVCQNNLLSVDSFNEFVTLYKKVNKGTPLPKNVQKLCNSDLGTEPWLNWRVELKKYKHCDLDKRDYYGSYATAGMAFVLNVIYNTNSLQEALSTIALACGDADSNCAVAAQILGAIYGYEAFPKEWVDAVNEHKLSPNVPTHHNAKKTFSDFTEEALKCAMPKQYEISEKEINNSFIEDLSLTLTPVTLETPGISSESSYFQINFFADMSACELVGYALFGLFLVASIAGIVFATAGTALLPSVLVAPVFYASVAVTSGLSLGGGFLLFKSCIKNIEESFEEKFPPTIPII